MTEQEYLDAIAWASAFSRGEGLVLDPKKTAMRMAAIIVEQDARLRSTLTILEAHAMQLDHVQSVWEKAVGQAAVTTSPK